MAFESLIIGLVTLSPPIFFLYMYVGEHENEFMHNKMMLYMAMGLILGTVFWVFERLFFSMVMLIFIAFLEELTKSVILNRKSVQSKKEAVWYGSALGFIMGAIMVSEMMYGDYMSWGSIEPWSIISFFALSVSYSAMHGSTAALIGYGSYTNRSWRYLFKAYLIHVLFVLIFFLQISREVMIVLLVLYTMFNYVRVYRIISE